MLKIYLPTSGPDFKHSHVISPPIKCEEKELKENKRQKIENINFFIKPFLQTYKL
tara:strand:- start:208 stop:372 length:165 start_codon:yes stop_codon:yes gene_type:complete